MATLETGEHDNFREMVAVAWEGSGVIQHLFRGSVGAPLFKKDAFL